MVNKKWVMLPATLKAIEGFHIHYVCRMTGMMPSKRHNRTWKYPKLETVLRAAGL